MAVKKEKEKDVTTGTKAAEDFTADLISSINREFGDRIAFNLAEQEAPTIIKRWIDTGSIQLNYLIANKPGGGYPEGRIIEIAGLPSSGKSHLAYHAAAVTQAMGGLVVYIDTENATPLDKLSRMGIDVKSRFVYVDTHCTEEVFKIIESIVMKAKQTMARSKDSKEAPILVIWDSLAATSPKAELDGEYDKETMGLQARVVSKGMRKITGIIGQNNVTLLIINQLRSAIGVIHGDPHITPGGKAVPFHSSVRIRLGSGAPIVDKNKNVIGINVTVSIKKNKVAMPYRKCSFHIIFGKGVVESEQIFDEVRRYCEQNGAVTKSGYEIMISGSGGWKEININDATTGEVVATKKFHKPEFGELMKSKEFGPFIMAAVEATYTLSEDSSEFAMADEESQDDSNDEVLDD